jgi:hypothetical protein
MATALTRLDGGRRLRLKRGADIGDPGEDTLMPAMTFPCQSVDRGVPAGSLSRATSLHASLRTSNARHRRSTYGGGDLRRLAIEWQEPNVYVNYEPKRRWPPSV